MPEYLSPGVYVEEIATGPRPIEGVGTSTAGFVGQTERGPIAPQLVTSWLAYRRWFGAYTANSFLPHAVQGFFTNGGQRAFIARVVGDDAVDAHLMLKDSDGNDVLDVKANGPGAWGNNLMIKVQRGSLDAPDATPKREFFRLTIIYYAKGIPSPFVDPTDPKKLADPNRREPDVFEDYDNLSREKGSPSYVESVINPVSRLIQLAPQDGLKSADPKKVNFGEINFEGGQDDEVTGEDYLGNEDEPEPNKRTGLAGLAAIDDIAILVAPDDVNTGVTNNNIATAILDQCEILKDRFAVLNVDEAETDPVRMKVRDSSYGAVYHPWIRVFDPLTQDTKLVPPSGHVAGIYARTDIERGVHKAPANEVVRGIINRDINGTRKPLKYLLTKGDQDLLNPRGINVIRDFRKDGRDIRVWGARTMSSDSMWKYVNVRRLFIFVEESIDQGTQWVVFEPNDEPTWAMVRRSISNFLISVWRSGALMGATQEEAFFVKCDRTTMTQDDIDNGRLICYIGIAPVKPAEFVIFRISQKTIETQA
jgi:phage tail sheath protein FI